MATVVLITGGAGFVGGAIVRAIKEKHPDWAISVFDVNAPSFHESGVSYVAGDITSPDEVHRVVSGIRPCAVIHTAGIVPSLASRYGRSEQERVFEVNVGGTRNVIAAAKHAGAAAEALILAANDEKGLATCALRPSVLIGPGDYQLIPSIHACIAKGESPFVVGDGLNLWDVTYETHAAEHYVTNVADAHVQATENLLSTKTAAGEAIFISNEQPIPFRHFCLAVWAEFGHYPSHEIKIPRSLAAFAGSVADLVTRATGTPTTLSQGSVNDACHVRYCNGTKARLLLGYQPREYKLRLKQSKGIGNRQDKSV
ncbi:MAG: hypothetical protein Q9191_002349 [Dirinaria sp. TL-2023a]